MTNLKRKSEKNTFRENDKVKMSNNKYDLEERTTRFGKDVILLLQKISENSINTPLKSQLIRSATSIGANYREADGSDTKKEFIHRISLCKREAKESCYWLEMLEQTNVKMSEEFKKLHIECHELVLIFSRIAISSKNK